MDLTPLLQDRVHLTGFDCQAIRALRQLKATFSYPFGPKERIEFVQVSNSNPGRVTCHNCWQENAEVQHAFAQAHQPVMSGEVSSKASAETPRPAECAGHAAYGRGGAERRAKVSRLTAYKCGYCDWWHLDA